MWTDTHAHLDDNRFHDDLPAVLERAVAAGVTTVIAVATTSADSRAVPALAAAHPHILKPSVGIHPNHVAGEPADAWDAVSELARLPDVVAIGETGLDRHWDFTPFAAQEDYFARHLALARREGLPVIVHARDAEADVLRMLRDDFDRHGPVRGVLHSFAGDLPTAEAGVAMGMHVSFSGILTYKNADALRAVAAALPVERLLVETDCPYLSPVPLRGKRNEPANVVHTGAVLAGLHGLTPAALAEVTARNAAGLFRRG
jgi:TatD DNase family protein